jgi:glucose-6-phosphate isomerase
MKRWMDASWSKEMRIEVDANFMMSHTLGEKEGLSEEELERLIPLIQDIHGQMAEGSPSFLSIPFDLSLVPRIKKFVQGAKPWVENFVVLGVGGSVLGAKALQRTLTHPYYNLLSKTMRKGFPRFFVVDNVEPDGFKALLDILEVRKTLFNVVGKSGGTAETMSQFLIIRDLLKKKVGNRKERDHLVITTDPENGGLRKIVEEDQIRTFEIPPSLGEEFSALSAAGLLPAAMCGVDVEELQAGARETAKRCQTDSIWKNPAYLCAGLSFLSYKLKKKSIRVVMPYAEALKDLGEWFGKLWAGSLGKRYNIKGREVWNGQTPLTASGAADQHSQLQLCVEGPGDKVFTFIGVRHYVNLMPVPKLYPKKEEMAYLGGRSLNQLIQAEISATRLILARNGRPSFIITLPKLNPFTIGQLIFLWQLETVVCGQLMGVNPLDRPGPEEGEKMAYAYLGRKGFEDRLKEEESLIRGQGNRKYVL